MDMPRDRPHGTPRRGHEFRHLAAAIGVSVAGSLMFLLVPVLVEALRAHAPWLSEQQIGFIGSGDTAGMLLGAILVLALAGRFDRRWLAAAGLALLCLANVGSLFAGTYPVLAVTRVLAGIGGGLAVGVAHAAFAATRHPERSIATYLVVQTCAGSAVVGLLARAIPTYGPGAVFLTASCLGLLGCILSPWVDARPASVRGDLHSLPSPVGEAAIHRKLAGFLCLSSNVLLGAAFMAAWANVDSIGKSYGLSPDAVAASISLSLLAATAGSLLVALLGNLLGRAWPFLAITGMTLAGIVLLGRPLGATAYGAALVMMMFGTSSTSYIFGTLSRVDGSGRFPIAHVLSLKAGFSMGPALGSFLIIHGGYGPVLWFAGMGTFAVMLVSLWAFRLLP